MPLVIQMLWYFVLERKSVINKITDVNMAYFLIIVVVVSVSKPNQDI